MATHTFISQKDMDERNKMTQQRIRDVAVSCGFINEAFTEYERLELEKAKEAHWQHHLRCDGLPRPYLPPEIRTFLAEKQRYQQFLYDHAVDWTLSVDNRTILTQNTSYVDRTRETVKEQLNDHISDYFQKDIYMFLEILVKMECMLDNPSEMSKIDNKLKMEIMQVRKEIEQEIDASFDRLSYRIIRMDGVYMDSRDAIVATWGHKCEKYAIDIWGLRDVSIRFDQMLAPMMIADLVNVGASVQMPESVLHDCLTLRCIHTKFDTYSQYAKSHDVIIPETRKESSAGIIDIEKALAHEWESLLDIQDEVSQQIIAKNEVYEEIMRIIVERTEKAAREKKSGGEEGVKSLPIPKAPKEPIKLPPGMLPNVDKLFLEREQQEYLNMLDEIYSPQNLNLQPKEINLRQYLILGGLYSIMFLRRPVGTNFSKFNITLNDEGRLLHKMSDIVADVNNERDTMLKKRTSSLTGRTKLNINEKKKRMSPVMLEDSDLPYFFVTLQLSQDVCLWGEPVACQYIIEMQDIPSEVRRSIKPLKTAKSNVYKSLLRLSSRTSKKSSEQGDMQAPSVEYDRHSNIFRQTLISFQRHSMLLPPGKIVVPVKNFSLQKPLNHSEIREMQRYCVPRIISSFKMPQEVREELQKDSKPKEKSILMKHRSADIEQVIDYSYIDFNFDDQHAPERMFPLFPEAEHVIYDEDDIKAEKVPHPKSMYGILDTFDNIRLQYNSKYAAIMKQSNNGEKRSHKSKLALPPTSEVGQKKSSSIKVSSLSEPRSGSLFSEDSIHVPEVSTSVPEDGVADNDDSIVQGELEKVDEKPKIKVTHWTTEYIFETVFDRKNRTISIKTDRLGIFGLAFKRYEHFPFRDWCLQPNEENPDEVLLRVDTFHARVMLYISAEGVRGYVTDLTKNYVAKPIKYLDIPTPIGDFRILRARFLEKSINIFADPDASYYIDNGYFSVKHVATEDHIYDAMALHCKLMKFYRSSWNRLASRRDLLICMKNIKDQSDFSEVTVRLTPDTATFVEVSEICSDNLDIIKVDYKNTWRNMSNYTDLHQAITSMNPTANEVRNKDSLLLFQIKRILREIHIMSYS